MDENKIEALGYALEQTDELIELFEHVVKNDFPYEAQKKDFSSAVEKLISKKDSRKDAPVEEKPIVEEKVFEDIDERLNMSLDRLKECANSCSRCRLCSTRKSVVFGEGCTDHPDVMVIGEGPGETEDNTGRPFVGAAGQYLDKWLAPISLSRDKNVYITNIVKCRPPQNRDPQFDEKEVCKVFLEQQIDLIKPRAILCLGRPAASLLTGKMDAPIGQLRGRFFLYNNSIPMMCTYHPAAVLRDASLKVAVWDDLKKLAKSLNLEIVSGR